MVAWIKVLLAGSAPAPGLSTVLTGTGSALSVADNYSPLYLHRQYIYYARDVKLFQSLKNNKNDEFYDTLEGFPNHSLDFFGF